MFGNKVPPETIMMLFQDDQQHYRLVVAGDASMSCSLSQKDGAIVLSSTNTAHNFARLYCGMGEDPYDLIRDGMKQVTQMSTAYKKRVRPSKLGWCTWNAFYTQISGSKLVEQVQALLEKAPVKWMILDDGWQHTTNDGADNGQQWKERLKSIQESPSKFKDLSLRDAIAQIKSLGIEDVWVWHTLMGYWLGIDHDANIMYPHFTSGILNNDPSASREASVEKGIGIPCDCNRFFDTYHDYLRSCGVTGVKVDAQGVVGTLRPYGWNDSSVQQDAQSGDDVVLKLHKELSKSVQSHFGPEPNILHCMSHAPELIFRIRDIYDELPLLRASDDHYPDNPSSHGPHVVACAFNSLLLSHVSVPDWDMFTTNTTNESIVRLHAVSRCISGGPVYISDPPSQVREEVVDWICCSDGKVLPCCRMALPIAKCLLVDPLAGDSDPFVIFNTNGNEECVTSGVFGVFHLARSGTWDYEKLGYGPIKSNLKPLSTRTARIRPSDIPRFAERENSNTTFLALPFFFRQQAAILPTRNTEFKLDLQPLDCDAIAILPIFRIGSSSEIVVLGLKGMINGAGSVVDIVVDDNRLLIKARGCGRFQFGIRSPVLPKVLVDDVLWSERDEQEKIAGFTIVSIKLDTSISEYRRITIITVPS